MMRLALLRGSSPLLLPPEPPPSPPRDDSFTHKNAAPANDGKKEEGGKDLRRTADGSFKRRTCRYGTTYWNEKDASGGAD